MALPQNARLSFDGGAGELPITVFLVIKLSIELSINLLSLAIMPDNAALRTRTALGLTQAEFAQLMGVHAMTVSKWERSEASPTPYQLNLFDQFTQGAKDREVKDALKTALIGAGVAFAIALLLRHLLSKK